MDPRVHRRARRLSTGCGRRPGRAPGGADRDRLRALLRDGPRPALGADGPRGARRSAGARGSRRDDPVEAVRASYERGRHRRVRRAGRPRPAVPGSAPTTRPSSSTSGPTGRASCRSGSLEAGLDLTTMTRYREDFPFPVAFDEQRVPNTLAEALSARGRAPAARRGDGEVRARDLLPERRRGTGVGGGDADSRPLAARRRRATT